MFKPNDISDDLAAVMNGKLNIIKKADAHLQTHKLGEALDHMNKAAVLFEKAGDSEVAKVLTLSIKKIADVSSPFAEHDMGPDSLLSELQNQINVLPEKDPLHIQGILEGAGFEVEARSADEVKATLMGSGDSPEVNVVVKPDAEPGMGGYWTIDVDPEPAEHLEHIAAKLNAMVKKA